MADRDDDRDRDRREDRRDELIEDELKALDKVMESIEDLNGAAQSRVLRAAQDLLPPPTTPIPTPR